MAAVFVRPLPFTVTSTAASIVPPTYLNVDEPGMVWRATVANATVTIDLGSVRTIDSVALVGTNLLAADSVKITAGTASETGTLDRTAAAYTGDLPEGGQAISIHRFNAVSARYVKVTITGADRPYIEVERLVVGKAILTGGIGYNAQQGFEDNSEIDRRRGYVVVDEYAVYVSWKFSTGFIKQASWTKEWFPFLKTVGTHRGFLFIPDDTSPADYQTSAIYGMLTTRAYGEVEYYDAWRVEGTIVSLS